MAVATPAAFAAPAVTTRGPDYQDVDIFTATGNVGWENSYLSGGGDYLYRVFLASTGAQYDARWWDIDFGAGGLYDITLLHITGFDVGIYSVRVDDREVGTIDGYSGPDVPNVFSTISNVPVSGGFHRLALVMATTNPSSTGLRYYGAIFQLYLRRTAYLPQRSLPGGVPRGARVVGRTIDFSAFLSAGNASWNTLNIDGTTTVYNGYVYCLSNGNSIWWNPYLPAGTWDVDVFYVPGTNRGIVAIQLDGITVGTVDMYGAFADHARAVVRVPVMFTGKHKLALTVVGQNGSSSGFAGTLRHLQLRQVRALPGTPQTLDPWHIDFDIFDAAGSSHWSTLNNDSGELYNYDLESDNTVGATRWWYLDLGAGTWDCSLLHYTGPNRGIYSIQVDDVTLATIDGYSGGTVKNVSSTATGIKVATSGRHKFALVMATKNGSSSAYYGTAQALQLRKAA